MKPKLNATDYITVDSRSMHGNEKLDEAVSVGQLIFQLSNSLLKTNKQTNKQKYNI